MLPSDCSKVFVSNIDPETPSISIRREFEKYGTVVKYKSFTTYAFVHMASEGAAQEAICEIDGLIIDDRCIAVKRAKSQYPKNPITFYEISNISSGEPLALLLKLLKQYGVVLNWKRIFTGIMVRMAYNRDSYDILDDLDGLVIMGATITIRTVKYSEVIFEPADWYGEFTDSLPIAVLAPRYAFMFTFMRCITNVGRCFIAYLLRRLKYVL